MAEKLTDEQKLTAQTSVVSAVMVKLQAKLPVPIFAKFVGTLSAVSSLGVSWIESIPNSEDRQKLSVALASRMLDVADVLIAVGNGMKLSEAFIAVGNRKLPATTVPDATGDSTDTDTDDDE